LHDSKSESEQVLAELSEVSSEWGKQGKNTKLELESTRVYAQLDEQANLSAKLEKSQNESELAYGLDHATKSRRGSILTRGFFLRNPCN